MKRALLLGLISSVASASVSTPFPGVTLVRSGSSAMVITDLCAPGVSVRATRYGERQGTPQQWGQAVGVQAAINVDFFDFPGWTLVNGRARGGGEDWPADKQFFESRSYWYFGLFTAGLQQNADVPPAGNPWMTEIVGGHNVLIRDGQSLAPNFDGDGVLAGGHRRTAIGMSRDRRTLFMMSTNKLLDGTGIVAELLALAAEAGAPAIDVATNVDGGGSSQLYVEGQGQIITSGRQVNNHLGVYASGSGATPHCTNIPPRGVVDAVSCEGVAGWAQDQNVADQPIDTYVSFDGPALVGPGRFTRAGARREDLCAAIGSCDHGFVLPTPRSLMDGRPHEVHVYAMDSEGGVNTELARSPGTLTCSRPAPEGVLRHVVDPASFAAWRFDVFQDVQPLTDEALGTRVINAPWPTQPELVRVAGQPEVYLRDGALRRRVPNPTIAAAWRLDLTTAREVPSSALAASTEGPPLPAPWLVRGTGPAIYVMDSIPRAPAPRPPAAPVETPEPPGGPPAEPRLAPDSVVGGCSAGGPSLLAWALLLGLRRRPY